VVHYHIYELDPADRIVDDYSVMCRSDTAALAMAGTAAESRAAAVEVWEDRLDPVTPWERLRRPEALDESRNELHSAGSGGTPTPPAASRQPASG
jgi:hypothetical protein